MSNIWNLRKAVNVKTNEQAILILENLFGLYG